jgi:hypothetical protein
MTHCLLARSQKATKPAYSLQHLPHRNCGRVILIACRLMDMPIHSPRLIEQTAKIGSRVFPKVLKK